MARFPSIPTSKRIIMQRQIAEDFEMPDLDPRFNPLSTLDNSQTSNRYASDHKLFVTFETRAIMNPLKSTEAGRPVYDQKDYIKIMTPGSQLSTIVAPVHEGNYMERFGKRYKEWKAGQEQVMSGTPVESFPYLLGKVALIAELKAMHIQTVEQLADLPDVAKQKIMGGLELCRRAAEWINQTSGTDAQVAKLADENAKLKQQMEQMNKTLEMLAAPKTAKEK
jgi:hypothetical protein